MKDAPIAGADLCWAGAPDLGGWLRSGHPGPQQNSKLGSGKKPGNKGLAGIDYSASRKGSASPCRKGSAADHPVMIEPPMSPGFASGEQYREMAIKLRELARLCRFAYGRREVLQFAAVFNRRADHFDSRAL